MHGPTCIFWANLTASSLSGLQKAAYAAKMVFPQDPFAGYIVRTVPLLAVPLHAVFILLVGQVSTLLHLQINL
jgi:hypothetical protein